MVMFSSRRAATPRPRLAVSSVHGTVPARRWPSVTGKTYTFWCQQQESGLLILAVVRFALLVRSVMGQ